MSVTRNHDQEEIGLGGFASELKAYLTAADECEAAIERARRPLSGADLSFFVPGKPQQQGSKTPWGADANDANLKPYRLGLASAALTQMQDAGLTAPHDGPVRLDCLFSYDRPRSHFNSKGELKANAPQFKISAPDRDKLLRSVGDALTGVAWKDDARIVSGWTSKEYGEFAGVFIDVWFL